MLVMSFVSFDIPQRDNFITVSRVICFVVSTGRRYAIWKKRDIPSYEYVYKEAVDLPQMSGGMTLRRFNFSGWKL